MSLIIFSEVSTDFRDEMTHWQLCRIYLDYLDALFRGFELLALGGWMSLIRKSKLILRRYLFD